MVELRQCWPDQGFRNDCVGNENSHDMTYSVQEPQLEFVPASFKNEYYPRWTPRKKSISLVFLIDLMYVNEP